MIIKKMAKSLIKIIFIYCLFLLNSISASNNEFDIWLKNLKFNGGEGGIRTHERVAPLLVFKTSAFNRSATSPRTKLTIFITIKVLK